MIITLTPNPSFDRTVELLAPLERGSVQRAASVISQAGGKGINISRAATHSDVPTIAVFPASEDGPFVDALRHDTIPAHPVLPTGEVRTNLTITEPGGVTTKLNTPGSSADAALLDRLQAAVSTLADAASWVVLAGSLAPGTSTDWYADVVIALRKHGARIAVDTSDAPLTSLVSRLPGAAPDLMKPNGAELADLLRSLGQRVDNDLEADPLAAADAAARLVDLGVGSVLATLGAGGAVLVDATGAWHATPPPTQVVSTVGAGDSSLFGYLYADHAGAAAPDRLRSAVAWGSAAASLPGTTIPRPGQTRPDLVTIRELTLRATD